MNPSSPPARLLDFKTAEELTGISAWTLRDLVARGSLPSVRLPGVRRVFLKRSDIDALIERCTERAS
jgi:excisionase family DNA binding protein